MELQLHASRFLSLRHHKRLERFNMSNFSNRGRSRRVPLDGQPIELTILENNFHTSAVGKAAALSEELDFVWRSAFLSLAEPTLEALHEVSVLVPTLRLKFSPRQTLLLTRSHLLT